MIKNLVRALSPGGAGSGGIGGSGSGGIGGSGSGRRYGDTNIEVLARATWTSFSFSPEGDYILVRECVDGQGASSFLWRSSDDLHIIH